MALGCAFIFIIVIWLYRRHQRKKRAKRAAQFAIKERTGWRWKLLRFGEKLFCHARSRRVPIVRVGAEDIKLSQIRMMEEARPVAAPFATNLNSMDHNREGEREEDLVQLIESYNPLPETYYTNRHVRVHLADQRSLSDSSSQHSAPSMYSQVTGLPHNVPEPRQPLKSRFSMSTFATNEVRKNHSGKKAFWKWSFFPLFFFFWPYLLTFVASVPFSFFFHTSFSPQLFLPFRYILCLHLCTYISSSHDTTIPSWRSRTI